MSEDRVRVRYSRASRTNRTPKNTLVTRRVNDVVYFGIARCNRAAGDVFKRSGPNGGSTIAHARLGVALNEDASSYVTVGNILVHPKGLRGQVNVANVKELIEFFNNIDAWAYRQGIEEHRTLRLEVA